MKIVFLTAYYPPFLKTVYEKNPDFGTKPFHDMMQILLNEYFADTGAAHAHAIKHGHESFMIISNCEPLQKKWADENKISWTESNWKYEIALAQIKYFKPDVFYLESVFEFFGDFVREARNFSKVVVSWISTPFTDDLDTKGIDLIVSSTPAFVETFKKSGKNSEYMLPAFDARVAELVDPRSQKTVPFSFVGGLSKYHYDRIKAVEFFVRHTPIQLWGYGFEQLFGYQQHSKRTLSYYKTLVKKTLSIESPVLKVYHGEAWGIEMYQILKDSLITFNIHEAYALNGKVGNMRMFEGTGMGSLVLNDYGSNLKDLFVPGKEIEVYHSLDEALEKVRYYIANPQKAIDIGAAGQRRTLRDYNYDIWIARLEEFCNTLLHG
jgi:hypothetical protein